MVVSFLWLKKYRKLTPWVSARAPSASQEALCQKISLRVSECPKMIPKLAKCWRVIGIFVIGIHEGEEKTLAWPNKNIAQKQSLLYNSSSKSQLKFYIPPFPVQHISSNWKNLINPFFPFSLWIISPSLWTWQQQEQPSFQSQTQYFTRHETL